MSRCSHLAVVVAVLAGMIASPCLAQGTETDGRRTLDRLPQNLIRPFAGLADKDAVVPLVVGSLGTAAARAIDDDVRRAVANPGTRFGRFFKTAGGPLASSIFVGGMFVAGQVADDRRFRDMTYDMLCASVATTALTTVLKLAVGRTRPNGANRRSFPSGHASSAFALATVAERHYGWKAGAPAYAVASAIAASRLVEDAHYLSDVVAGGTLGYMLADATVRVNDEPVGAADAGTAHAAVVWSINPVVGRRSGGVVVSLVF